MQIGQWEVHRLKVGLIEICPKSGGAASAGRRREKLGTDGRLL